MGVRTEKTAQRPPADVVRGARARGDLDPPKSFGGKIRANDRVYWVLNGVKLVLRSQHGRRATPAQRRDIIRAIGLLPAADRRLLRREHTQINVFPRHHFGDPREGSGGRFMVGQAFLIGIGNDERHGSAIRVAADNPWRIETTQHEVGHVVSWVRHADASERAAERYAARY